MGRKSKIVAACYRPPENTTGTSIGTKFRVSEEREVALQLTPTQLSGEDGVTTLLDHLKTVFAKDQVYEAYLQFEKISRGDLSMNDYILEFEKVNHRLQQMKIALPSVLLACKLLYSAGITDVERRMVLSATSTLEYENMKASLKRIVGGESSKQSLLGVVKAEPVFAAVDNEASNSDNAFWSNRGRYRRNFTKQGRGGIFGAGRNSENGTNPLNQAGKMCQCFRCGSRFHLIRNCPETEGTNVKATPEGKTNDQQSYFTFASAVQSLRVEAAYEGIVDSGCTKTVAGDAWFASFDSKLPSQAQKMVSSKKEWSVKKIG